MESSMTTVIMIPNTTHHVMMEIDEEEKEQEQVIEDTIGKDVAPMMKNLLLPLVDMYIVIGEKSLDKPHFTLKILIEIGIIMITHVMMVTMQIQEEEEEEAVMEEEEIERNDVWMKEMKVEAESNHGKRCGHLNLNHRVQAMSLMQDQTCFMKQLMTSFTTLNKNYINGNRQKAYFQYSEKDDPPYVQGSGSTTRWQRWWIDCCGGMHQRKPM